MRPSPAMAASPGAFPVVLPTLMAAWLLLVPLSRFRPVPHQSGYPITSRLHLCFNSFICSGDSTLSLRLIRNLLGSSEDHDIEGWVEKKCSTCLDGGLPPPPPPQEPAKHPVAAEPEKK